MSEETSPQAPVPGPEEALVPGSSHVPIELTFEVDGVTWTARSGGQGAAGWGSRSPAAVEAVHFYRGEETRPRFEVLTGRGRLAHLHPEELAALLRRALPVPPA